MHGEAQSLSELALQAPEPAVGGRRGFGEARAFLNPDLVVSILPAASRHREETNPAPTKLC
jgi:hypothetical protein